MLHLQGGVIDAVVAPQHLCKPESDLMTVRICADDHMR